MPPGRPHTQATLIATFVLTGVSAYLVMTTNRPDWVGAIAGGLSGLFLGPDTDVDDGSIANYHARRIGFLFGVFWRAYWYPYAKLFPHRGLISHTPILSTLIRIVYLFWWWGVWWLLWALGYVDYFWFPSLIFVLSFVGGLILVDAIHIVMDFTSTRVKGWIRKLRERMHQWAFGNGS